MVDDRAAILDMVAALESIRRFVSGRTRDAFLDDDVLQSAVLHKFTILGAACRRVSNAFRDAHSDIEWHAITSFRNQIVHEYDDINLDRVWEIIAVDVPAAIAQLWPLVPQEPPDGEEIPE